MDLHGKRYIVTGGANGMGAAVVGALVSAGAGVASIDVAAEQGAQVVERANGAGPGAATFHRCDVSQRDEVAAAFAAAVAALGGLDGLVHAAGIEDACPPENLTDERWDRTIAVNLTGTFLTNQAAYPHLKEGGGVILNFASDTALIPYSWSAHYAATKGAVVAWTRSIGAAWGKHNIRANCMVPAIRTPMYDAHCAQMTPEEMAQHRKDLAQRLMIRGEFGDPARDLAPVVLFMLSDGASYITGQLISVNGGVGVTR